MKQKASGLILMIGAVVLSAQARADDFPACATAAAQEFAVPVKLFKAMALAEVRGASPEAKQRAKYRNLYGPMGLGDPALPVMASGLGVSVASVKEDACTNYRAAAWWFVNKAGGNQGDMWEAVTKFYYGKPTQANAYATDRVKKIYAELQESSMETKSDPSDVVAQARVFLNRLAEGARVKRLGVPQLETEATYHYAKGYVQALAHFELCSLAEAETLSKQVAQWPAPLADDGKLWQQPWVEHGTKPFFVQTIHLDVLDMKSPVQFHYECTCGNFSHFWVGPPWLKDGQMRADGTCDVCEHAVIGFSDGDGDESVQTKCSP